MSTCETKFKHSVHIDVRHVYTYFKYAYTCVFYIHVYLIHVNERDKRGLHAKKFWHNIEKCYMHCWQCCNDDYEICWKMWCYILISDIHAITLIMNYDNDNDANNEHNLWVRKFQFTIFLRDMKMMRLVC